MRGSGKFNGLPTQRFQDHKGAHVDCLLCCATPTGLEMRLVSVTSGKTAKK